MDHQECVLPVSGHLCNDNEKLAMHITLMAQNILEKIWLKMLQSIQYNTFIYNPQYDIYFF